MNDVRPTVWQAARATSAATSFFDPVMIGDEEFVDGALGHNNPLKEVWCEAKDIWDSKDEQLEPMLKCVVSVGTGHPGSSAVGQKPWTIAGTLKRIATETEATQKSFTDDHRRLTEWKDRRYYRFNVQHGLEKVKLDEHKQKGVVLAATRNYLNNDQHVKSELAHCASIMSQKECMLAEDFS